MARLSKVWDRSLRGIEKGCVRLADALRVAADWLDPVGADIRDNTCPDWCTLNPRETIHWHDEHLSLDPKDTPKMLTETFCVSQAAIGVLALKPDEKKRHIDRLTRLINQQKGR